MRSNTRHIITRLALVLATLLPVRASAAEPNPGLGIRTDFGDVLIENLGIGRTYNLRELAGRPMTVQNKGVNPMELVMEVTVPTWEMITKSRQEKGFKPIPSTGWVKLSKDHFIVPAGETAFADMVIDIPNDPTLYGKKFQVSINSHSESRAFLNLGVWSHFMFTIVPSPEAQAEVEKNRKRGVVATLDYRLEPDRLYIDKAQIGTRFEVRKEMKQTIKIANSGEAAVDLAVEIVPIDKAPLSLQAGFEAPPEGSEKWLTVKSNAAHIEPDSFYDPGLVLQLPNDPALHKKHYMFVMKVHPSNADEVGVTFYGSIYVEVQ